MKKTIIATTTLMMLSASMLSASAFAAKDTGHGVVKFTGSIIDAPCSIAPESMDQTVNMGLISNVLLEKQGETPIRPFTIKLESCTTETADTATVTFNGNSDPLDKNHLAISGKGKGAAIALVNQLDDTEIVLGTKTKAINLIDGDNELKFGAKLVSTVKEGQSATPGEFSATTNFIVSYQ
ncbi:fimbrial protein [Vibrio cholerae]|uniref:fimbrial protein n=1 Tax=Vibrio cholerae TaxID=666 RepID=UPI0018F0DD04|nr:fimbrial protein [Vibrio cholerae]ELF5324218.1 type 1 fimbrial protein [Vibrio cholerae]MBJ6887614.1 type 1 fimbrial protein [Vibrio cholerae]HDZ9221855.1 type 1 fimbrial protein [Vibrio cholerae]